MIMKIYIDPGCNLLYSSFYIKGLNDFFGKKNVSYKNKPFINFKVTSHFLAFVIKDDNINKNIIIDFADTSRVEENGLKWCDLYFKINIDEKINYNTNKLVSIGPSFAIKLYNYPTTLFLALINYLKSRKRITNKRYFFSCYKAQLNRPKISDYYPSFVKKNYIYFVSSLWKKEKQTNKFRANFIKACTVNKKISFDGGFAPRSKNDINGYEELTMIKRDSINTYIKKMKKSNVAFNTPAVTDCHGWKLGEFLCFGKAIISTEIKRKLPIKLIDRQHVLYTNGDITDIEEKINELLINNLLRKELEKNARKYFENELSPISIIKKIVDKCSFKNVYNNNFK